MITSRVRPLANISLTLVAITLSACASVEAKKTTNVRFAGPTTASVVASPALRVIDVRSIGRRVNLQEPIALTASGDQVDITFAFRHREGVTIALAPESVQPRLATPYSFPAHTKPATPHYVVIEPSRVELGGGRFMSCWNDNASRRVFAQAYSAEGTPRGAAVVVSPPAMDVIGSPRAVTTNGHHIVVTFFASGDEGFEVVAASLAATES
jgi:hypothetical protein